MSGSAAAFDPFAAAGWTAAPATPTAPPANNNAPQVSQNLIPIRDPKTGITYGYERAPDQPGAAATPDAAPAVVTPSTGKTTPTPTPPAATPAKEAPAQAPSQAEAFDPFKAAGWTAPEAGAAAATPAATPAANTAVIAKPPAQPPVTTPEVQQQLHEQPWYQHIANAVQSANEGFKGATDVAQHAFTMGLDEILAPLVPAVIDTLSTGQPFSQAYDNAVQKMRAPRQAFEAAHPGLSAAIGLGAGAGSAGVTAPLFASAPAATIAGKAANAVRNVVAGTGTGAAAGFGLTDGDVQQRLEGARQGAEFGGALSVAAPMVGSALGGAYRALRPGTQTDQITGRILNEATGGVPPTFEPSPIPGAPLNIAQASGSPELASLVDTRNAANLAALKREQAAQNSAVVQNVPGTPGTNVAPEAAAARGSARFTAGVKSGTQLANTEERRVWNTPALTDKNMTSASSKRSVADAVLRIEAESPGLHDAMQNSGEIRSVLRDLAAMPDKVSANELNSIASRLKAIGRNPREDDSVRLVAKRLAGAAHDGLWNAPEVVGRAPNVIPPTTEIHTLPDGSQEAVQIAGRVEPGVKPIPGLVRDLNKAREFTRQEAETFGHASFDNIVGRNSYGNATVSPGTAANRFFDFATGTEKPGAIKDAIKFLNDIKSEWLKLGNLGTQYDPAGVQMAQTELKEGLREYLASKFLSVVSSNNADMLGNQMVSAAKAADWLANNRAMLERTGVYTGPEMDAWLRVEKFARMINRGNNLGQPVNSATYSRLVGERRWLDLFMSPLQAMATGSAISGVAGATLGHFLGDTALGAILGAEGGAGAGLGAALLQRIYAAPREAVLRRLDEAIRDPDIAADLMKRAGQPISQKTKQWMRSWYAQAPSQAIAPMTGVPQ